MALLQYEIYGDIINGVLEKWGFDLVDREKKIMAEVGQIRGRQSPVWAKKMLNYQAMSLLVRDEIAEESSWSEWDFYGLTYKRNEIIKCKPSDEVIKLIKDNIVDS